jgi:hypothetical protein
LITNLNELQLPAALPPRVVSLLSSYEPMGQVVAKLLRAVLGGNADTPVSPEGQPENRTVPDNALNSVATSIEARGKRKRVFVSQSDEMSKKTRTRRSNSDDFIFVQELDTDNYKNDSRGNDDGARTTPASNIVGGLLCRINGS